MNQLGSKYIYTWKCQKESPCVAIFILNKQKCHFFLFSSTKSENRRVKQALPGWGPWGALVSVEGEVVGKGCKRVILCKFCIPMYVNAKMIPVETLPGMGKQVMKENDRGGEFK
jgi:hypothetical protein